MGLLSVAVLPFAAGADVLIVRQGAHGERAIPCVIHRETDTSFSVQMLVGKRMSRATFPNDRVLRVERHTAEENAALLARWAAADAPPAPAAPAAPATQNTVPPPAAPTPADPDEAVRTAIRTAGAAARRRVDVHYRALRTRVEAYHRENLAKLDAAAMPEQYALIRATQARVLEQLGQAVAAVRRRIDATETRGLQDGDGAAAGALHRLAAAYVATAAP